MLLIGGRDHLRAYFNAVDEAGVCRRSFYHPSLILRLYLSIDFVIASLAS